MRFMALCLKPFEGIFGLYPRTGRVFCCSDSIVHPPSKVKDSLSEGHSHKRERVKSIILWLEKWKALQQVIEDFFLGGIYFVESLFRGPFNFVTHTSSFLSQFCELIFFGAKEWLTHICWKIVLRDFVNSWYQYFDQSNTPQWKCHNLSYEFPQSIAHFVSFWAIRADRNNFNGINCHRTIGFLSPIAQFASQRPHSQTFLHCTSLFFNRQEEIRKRKWEVERSLKSSPLLYMCEKFTISV